MKSLNEKEIRELILKSWMTHDGMWFLHCLRKTGIEKTNKINKAASRGLGLIESKRYKKSLGIEEIKTFIELKNFIDRVIEIVKADFMKFSYDFSIENECHFEMHRCFAYEGIKRIGVLDDYICGIYDRIEGWFDGLGIKYEVSPQIDRCLMNEGKKCRRIFKYYFK